MFVVMIRLLWFALDVDLKNLITVFGLFLLGTDPSVSIFSTHEDKGQKEPKIG